MLKKPRSLRLASEAISARLRLFVSPVRQRGNFQNMVFSGFQLGRRVNRSLRGPNMRTLYGIRNGRVVRAEAVPTSIPDEQRRLASSRLHEFDLIEIWDGPILCVRLSRATDKAEILDFNKVSSPSEVVNVSKVNLTNAA